MAGTARILVVEDDPRVAEVISCNLTSSGYTVTIVADGLDALLAFDAQAPALVTLDLGLPTISGFRLIKLFKHHRPWIPVVVVTASAFEEIEEVADAGADDIITKPFDPQILVQQVRHRLRSAPRRDHEPSQSSTFDPRSLTAAAR